MNTIKPVKSIKSVFVTGADGLLGSSIVRELLKQNYQVRCLVQTDRHTGTLDNLPVEIYEGDLMIESDLEDAIKGCDAVINVAASTVVWPSRNEKTMRINLEGVHIIVNASKKAEIKRFIHIGSANSFGPGSASKPGDETTPYDGWKYRMNYIDSKFLSQQYLLKEYSKNNFPVIILNPTFMIGPYDSGPSSGRLVLSIVKGKLPGYTKGVKNFVHAADVAVAAVNALKMGRLGECYIAGNKNMELKSFFQLVSEVAETPMIKRYIPYPFVFIGGILGSIWGRIFGKSPNISLGIARTSVIKQYYSPSKAIQELKMPQTPIEQAIEDCLTWFKTNSYWNPANETKE